MIDLYESYCESPIVQLLCTFIIGLILSWLSVSLTLILGLAIVFEAILFSFSYHTGKYNMFLRTSLVFSSVAGWLVGRSLFRLKSHYVCEHYDSYCGLRCVD